MKFWLPLEILSWPSRSEGGSIFAAEERPRSYAHLRRAEHFLLESKPTEHDLADCIRNLRTCFTHRLKLIEKYYNIRSAVDAPQKRPLPELLSEVGIIRPLMVKTLLDVRNSIEYADAAPPRLERCREFAEAVWYLLRSTDSILEVGRTEVSFSENGKWEDEDDPWFSLSIEYKPDLKLSLRGRFPHFLISHQSIPRAMTLEADYPSSESTDMLESAKNGTRRFVMGVLNLTSEECKVVLRAAFEAVPS